MHVQCHEQAATQNALVDLVGGGKDRREHAAAEDLLQRRPQLPLPRDADDAVLQHIEQARRGCMFQAFPQLRQQRFVAEPLEILQRRRERRVEMLGQPAPALADLGEQGARPRSTLADHFFVRQVAHFRVVGARQGQSSGEQRLEPIEELQLVGDRKLDVDALDLVGVRAEARQRQHHVLVDLEGIGVSGDRGGARAV
jgi:hypothetical protein